ncbi:hypothetical protein SERLADRAFT_434909 [Serpula lacrymans var. lacrymans S7.9]|nr:uncharacterized protein SERLADRAFT_434909 [Serpula lacrymans var. lacrymans S7.9]EGO27140.1 hypothetical protein SERLADRAFT_434909 [Serpula lacrymans var. lacrymans S7.9]
MSHLPPHVSLSEQVLSSVVSLPDNPVIAYTTFTTQSTTIRPYEALELARRLLVNRNKGLPLLDSLLPCVNVSQDLSALQVFAITSRDHVSAKLAAIKDISFDGLTVSGESSFTPHDLYPCSLACSDDQSPCPSCLKRDPSSLSQSTLSSPACLLPRKPLRSAYYHFLDAVRKRLIDDISEASRKTPHGRCARGFQDGFLLSPPRSYFDWGVDWQHHVNTRPFIHCHLEIHLATSRLEIHPIIRPTHFSPLSVHLPLAPGTPIALMPYSTPAFFLATYTGPTSALSAQFEQSLAGLGAGDWKTMTSPYSHSVSNGKHRSADPSARKYPMYIIAWLAVENKQGEDKGMNIIWPTELCLSYLPSSKSAHARQTLAYIPDLPPPLQPSPPPPPPPAISISSPVSAGGDGGPTSPIELNSHRISRPVISRICTSPTGEYLRAFRSLTVSKSKGLDEIATEVGGYVEVVAKEREKERERIRRERENAHFSASPRAVVTPPTALPSSITPGVSMLATTSVDIVATPQHSQPPASAQTSPTTVASNQDSQPVSIPHQQFYPSPPQTNLPSGAHSTGQDSLMSSVEPTSALPTTAASEPEPVVNDPIPQPENISSSSSYDPFNMEPSWAQSNDDFMSIGMDYNMSFGISMDPIGGGGAGGGGAADRLDMDFEDGFTFTDDDFSFFDRPSASTRLPAVADSTLENTTINTGLTPAAGPAPLGLSPPTYGDGIHFSGSGSGPGPPPTPGQLHFPPWNPGALAEGYSPRFIDHPHAHDVIPPAPDLLPPSPGKTPSSHSAPVTPNVHVYGSDAYRPTSSNSNIFDPIPFANSHRIADGKYTFGKFALPSPPDEEDRTEPIPLSSSPLHLQGWKLRYNAVTDPRIGVVRKLIGVKRKSFDQGSRDHKSFSSWKREHEDWVSSNVVDDVEENKSDAESEDDDVEIDDLPVASRTSTPPPAYLPMGPTLLHTYFHHSLLLPLSNPLRPPGAAVAPTNIPTVAPTSVPTPVSPAAALGTASEKSKFLEAAGYMVASEMVENSVWADAWRSNFLSASVRPTSEIWKSDVSTLVQLVKDVPDMEGPLDLQTLFQLKTEHTSQLEETVLQKLEPPMFSICKSDSVIQVLPSAIRFWEKLGLGPLGGKKDIIAFVLFDEEGPEKQNQAEGWLNSISVMYTAKQLGTHVPGSCTGCPKDGIMPLRFDSFRKSLASFVASLPTSQSSLVFYIVTPDTAMSLASPLLRQVFSAVKRAQKTYSEAQILFQFVPERLIRSVGSSTNQDMDIEALCYSVYRRVPQPVDRYMSRRFSENGERIRNYFQEQPFTLARPLCNRVSFTLQSPARTLDVVDRHTLLHIGYQTSACGKWLIAACVDQRGEAHDLGVWLIQGDWEAFVVEQVWKFAVQFARKANIEWRLIFTKLGSMSENELNAWSSHLATVVPACSELPPFYVSLFSVDQGMPWTFISPKSSVNPSTPKRSPGKDCTKHIYLDVSATTYALFSPSPMPLMSPLSSATRDGADVSTIPDNEEMPPRDTLGVMPLSTTMLIRAPAASGHTAITMIHIHLLHSMKSPNSSLSTSDHETHKDVTRNFHELAVLSESTHRLRANPILPFHLAALETMHGALTQGDVE